MGHRVVIFLLIEIDPAQAIERFGVGRIGGQGGVDARPGLVGTAFQVARERGPDLRIFEAILNLSRLIRSDTARNPFVYDLWQWSVPIEYSATDYATD